jgi:TRAP-type C4-dicarboxylate transport system permease small subunit
METCIEWILCIIVGIMVVNVATGVFFRYVLQNSLSWTEELGRYLMIWMGYLGAVLAMKEGSHVGITSFIGLFPPVVRRVLEVLANLIVLAFLSIVLVKSFSHLETLSIQRSSAMELPMVFPYLAVTVGVFLMAIETLMVILGFRWMPDSANEGKRVI